MQKPTTILDDFIKPFKEFRAKVFNLTYKTQKIKASIYEDTRKKFWSKDNNVYKSKLNFYLDGTVDQCFNGDLNATEKNLWFEAVMFSKPGQQNFPRSNQYIILVCDAGDYFEKFEEKMKSLIKQFCNVICFNPPGVGKSPGAIENPQEYQAVLEALIDALHSEEIRYEDTILLGHGFGAAIALKVAADHQQRKEHIRVIADRCFASSAKLAGRAAQDKVNESIKSPIARKIIGTLAYYTVSGSVRILGLNVDAAACFTKIYTLNPKQVRAIVVENDYEITTEDNLASEVNIKMHGAIKTFICHSTRLTSHTAPLNELTISGESPSYMNSANDYVNIWMNAFNKEKFRPSREWANIEVDTSSSCLAEFNNNLTYMHNQICKLWGTAKQGELKETLDIEKQAYRSRRSHRSYSGGS